ncbi:MAG TPA: LPS export ABC transporter periplasmic protein LptC [Thiobacillaceae bacterium]|nr:LPS export ABC transporter periplasmic protein LptC [Thiobacillaceae bacterium]HNU64235.1 LPS export ABC transporter periplasmic protein LptC [Thiobacillaceae bacterium]
MTGGHQIHWLPLGLAGLLALPAFWLNQLIHRPVVEDLGGFAHEPDTIVENFNALAFNQQGQPLHALHATRLVHYMDDDTTELLDPRFSVQEPSGNRSEVRARRGQVSSNGQHVHFLGDVRLTRSAAGKPPITLETEYLWITPDAGIMRTDRPVTLKQGRAAMHANRLLMNEQGKEITLSGRVHARYE